LVSAGGRLRGLSTSVGRKRSRQSQLQEKLIRIRSALMAARAQGQNPRTASLVAPRRCTISIVRSASMSCACGVTSGAIHQLWEGIARCHDERCSWVRMTDRIRIAARAQQHEAQSPLHKACWCQAPNRHRHWPRVKSAVLAVGRPLPVYLDKQTCSGSVGMSQTCQTRTCHDCIGARFRATARAYCDLRTVFPKVISGLRRPIAIQAAISFNMNLPE
jgi:hypothetical protein